MTCSPELESKILRYFHVEKWKIGTIARQFRIHYSVVTRVLRQFGIPKNRLCPKGSIIDPYLNFINETLSKYPSLTASRLYGMVSERGYKGGPDHFRHVVATMRPTPSAEAYLRLRTLPGEQAQVDWAHFGYILIGVAKRPLMAFVMTLSYSRKIFLRFYLNQQMENFLRGHEAAFTAWNGVPRVLLYDNLKSLVLERKGDAIRFHPTLLQFSAHYRYEARPVAVARGNEKGRVERSIRYIRDNFFAAREWKHLEDLNEQAQKWCESQASNRPCPEDRQRTVREVFEEEQSKLISLPNDLFPTQEEESVRVGKTPYVRFDLNDYSVPHTHVRKTLKVIGYPDRISILEGTKIIAEHLRCYDKGQQIENEVHVEELEHYKSESKLHRAQNRLSHAVPSSVTLLKLAAEQGYSLSAVISGLLQLLGLYGAGELEIATKELLTQNSAPHPNSIRLILVKRREEQKKTPPIGIPLPEDIRVRTLSVQLHDLKVYDQLKNIEE